MILSEKMNERIRFLRIQHGYTQQYISDILGVGKSAYSMYESGERNISVEILTKLAKLYNVSTDYIIGLTNNVGNGNSYVESCLSDVAVRTIVEMSQASDRSALLALNTLLSDKQCCKIFTSLYKVLYLSQKPNVYIQESPEFEAKIMTVLKELLGLSGMSSVNSDNIIKAMASEMGISTRYSTKEVRNVVKMLFMTQIENFIDRNGSYTRMKNQMRSVLFRKE